MKFFSDYKKISNKSQHYKTTFTLNNIPCYIANSFRRALSSNVPTITFDDTYYDDSDLRSINIKSNTSALHDQFLLHRISLIPIDMENEYLGFSTQFNQDTGERQFKFNNENLITFKLEKKNDKSLTKQRDKLGLISVTSNDFVINDSQGNIVDTNVFFKNDVFTDDYILITKLKQSLSDDNNGEEINIDCRPTISMGRFNARNDPTGTVTYEMKVDDDKVDDILQKKIIYINKERQMKGLSSLNDTEISQITKSFNLLDKDRVVKKDKNGNPNTFIMSVESIGFLNPNSIINDSLTVLILMLKDIQNSFTFNHEDNFNYTVNNKIAISELDFSNVNEGININIKNENHTIGNLITNVMRNSYCIGGNDIDKAILKIASYKMNHPTIEEIDIVMVPIDKLSKQDMINTINKLTRKTNTFTKISKLDLRMILCLIIFQKSINKSLSILLKLKSEFSDLSSIDHSTFNINDSTEYFDKNTYISGNINSEHTHIDSEYLNNINSIISSKKSDEVTQDYVSPQLVDTPPYQPTIDIQKSTDQPSPQLVDTPPYQTTTELTKESEDDKKINKLYNQKIKESTEANGIEISVNNQLRIRSVLKSIMNKTPVEKINESDKDIIIIVINEIIIDGDKKKQVVLRLDYTDLMNPTIKKIKRSIAVKKKQ